MGAKVQKILHIRKRACNIFFLYRERDFLRKSLASLVKEKPKNTFRCAFEFSFQYRERDLNPHSHHWPKDFKSFVSTDSTIAARNRVQRYNKNCKYANKSCKKIILATFWLFLHTKRTALGQPFVILQVCLLFLFVASMVIPSKSLESYFGNWI